jgi:hypothetical protein
MDINYENPFILKSGYGGFYLMKNLGKEKIKLELEMTWWVGLTRGRFL